MIKKGINALLDNRRRLAQEGVKLALQVSKTDLNRVLGQAVVMPKPLRRFDAGRLFY
jgi:hypothetical protein